MAQYDPDTINREIAQAIISYCPGYTPERADPAYSGSTLRVKHEGIDANGATLIVDTKINALGQCSVTATSKKNCKPIKVTKSGEIAVMPLSQIIDDALAELDAPKTKKGKRIRHR